MNIEAEISNFQYRFSAHVPKNSSDISLPILKGHLLAEEIMTDFIISQIDHSEHLNLTKSYWSFVNKVELASSLSNDCSHDKWIWSSLKRLNSLRNKLSHGLEPEGLNKKIQSFYESVEPNVLDQKQKDEDKIYRYVLYTVSGLFIIIKSIEGKI